MQAPFSCTPATLAEFEAALAPARLARFLPAAGGDKHYAVRLYVWNARLCEEFYLPLQTAEVAVRNVIAETLKRRYGAGWYSSRSVRAILSDKHRGELDSQVYDQQVRCGPDFTGDHVVSGLSFGFWASWLTSSYEHHIWQQGIKRSFLNAPNDASREDAYKRVDQLRRFRNKVMHHYAIFDRSPVAEYQNLLEIVRWISPATVWLLKELGSPPRIVNKKPAL